MLTCTSQKQSNLIKCSMIHQTMVDQASLNECLNVARSAAGCTLLLVHDQTKLLRPISKFLTYLSNKMTFMKRSVFSNESMRFNNTVL